MADYTPADIPVLFDDIRLTGDGPGGSNSQFEKILLGMEKRFPPDEVWGVIDRMLRDTKYHNDAYLLARALAVDEDGDTARMRYDILYNLCADDTVEVLVRTDALVYLERLAGSDGHPLRSLYHVVKDTDMLGELSHGIIADDLVLNRLPRYRPLLLGLCAGKHNKTSHDEVVSDALKLIERHGREQVLDVVRFVAGHEHVSADSMARAKRLLAALECGDVR